MTFNPHVVFTKWMAHVFTRLVPFRTLILPAGRHSRWQAAEEEDHKITISKDPLEVDSIIRDTEHRDQDHIFRDRDPPDRSSTGEAAPLHLIPGFNRDFKDPGPGTVDSGSQVQGMIFRKGREGVLEAPIQIRDRSGGSNKIKTQ